MGRLLLETINQFYRSDSDDFDIGAIISVLNVTEYTFGGVYALICLFCTGALGLVPVHVD